jgi:hypothetical protein
MRRPGPGQRAGLCPPPERVGLVIVSGLASASTVPRTKGPGRRRGQRPGRHHRRRRHRARPRLPEAAPRARPPDVRRGRADAERVLSRGGTPGGALPAPQPHHCRPVTGHAGGRGRRAVRLADHRPSGARMRARGVRDPGFDPQPAIARLPPADQGWRQADRDGRRHPAGAADAAARGRPSTLGHRRPRRTTRRTHCWSRWATIR